MDYQLGPGPLQVDQNTIDEKIKGDIGIVENGDVATHAIPSGYYVIWKGDLYIAKTDISSGTTLSTSNLTAKPNGIGAEVAALNSNIGSINSALRPSDAGWIIDDNADNYKTTGQFMVARGWTNIPTGWGILTVIANRTDTIMQEYEAYNKKYIREFRNNAWSNWEQFALNSNSTPVSISNQYSTVLAAINAYRTTKTYPFCIQKSGASAVTDLPSSFPTTCEWNVICIGDAQRTTAVLTIYTGGSNKNGWTYKANIFNGAIIRDWFSLDEDLNSKYTNWVEITATTSATGSINLSQTTPGFGNTAILTSVYVVDQTIDATAILLRTYSGNWYAKVINWDLSPVANKSVTIRVFGK